MTASQTDLIVVSSADESGQDEGGVADLLVAMLEIDDVESPELGQEAFVLRAVGIAEAR
jgi:hypothetical protein